MRFSKIAQRTWYGGGGSGSPTPPSGCCYEVTTVAALQTLQAGGTMVQGTTYQITDVTADWQVIVMAESGTEIATQGQGIYQNSLYTEAYYDLATNTLYKIYDPKYNNEVEDFGNISAFQWDDASWQDNKILKSSVLTNSGNTIASFTGNNIINGQVTLNGCSIVDIYNNTIDGSFLDLTNASGSDFAYNTLLNQASWTLTGAQLFSVQANLITEFSVVDMTNLNDASGVIYNNSIANSTLDIFGNWVNIYNNNFNQGVITSNAITNVNDFYYNTIVNQSEVSLLNYNAPDTSFYNNYLSVDSQVIFSGTNNTIALLVYDNIISNLGFLRASGNNSVGNIFNNVIDNSDMRFTGGNAINNVYQNNLSIESLWEFSNVSANAFYNNSLNRGDIKMLRYKQTVGKFFFDNIVLNGSMLFDFTTATTWGFEEDFARNYITVDSNPNWLGEENIVFVGDVTVDSFFRENLLTGFSTLKFDGSSDLVTIGSCENNTLSQGSIIELTAGTDTVDINFIQSNSMINSGFVINDGCNIDAFSNNYMNNSNCTSNAISTFNTFQNNELDWLTAIIGGCTVNTFSNNNLSFTTIDFTDAVIDSFSSNTFANNEATIDFGSCTIGNALRNVISQNKSAININGAAISNFLNNTIVGSLGLMSLVLVSPDFNNNTFSNCIFNGNGCNTTEFLSNTIEESTFDVNDLLANSVSHNIIQNQSSVDINKCILDTYDSNRHYKATIVGNNYQNASLVINTNIFDADSSWSFGLRMPAAVNEVIGNYFIRVTVNMIDGCATNLRYNKFENDLNGVNVIDFTNILVGDILYSSFYNANLINSGGSPSTVNSIGHSKVEDSVLSVISNIVAGNISYLNLLNNSILDLGNSNEYEYVTISNNSFMSVQGCAPNILYFVVDDNSSVDFISLLKGANEVISHHNISANSFLTYEDFTLQGQNFEYVNVVGNSILNNNLVNDHLSFRQIHVINNSTFTVNPQDVSAGWDNLNLDASDLTYNGNNLSNGVIISNNYLSSSSVVLEAEADLWEFENNEFIFSGLVLEAPTLEITQVDEFKNNTVNHSVLLINTDTQILTINQNLFLHSSITWDSIVDYQENCNGNQIRQCTITFTDLGLDKDANIVNCILDNISATISSSHNGQSAFGSKGQRRNFNVKNNFSVELDPSVIVGNTLTIPISFKNYIGIFYVVCDANYDIDTIVNAPTGWEHRFYNSGSPNDLTFRNSTANIFNGTGVGNITLDKEQDFVQYQNWATDDEYLIYHKTY